MFRKLLNVNTAIFTNMRIETNEKGVSCIYVEAKINKKQANRCPIVEGSVQDMIKEVIRLEGKR